MNLAVGTVGGNVDNSATTWEIWARHSSVGTDKYNTSNVYLSFGTAALSGASALTTAGLVVDHAGTTSTSSVLLYGGTQPIFGTAVDSADFDDGTTLVGSQTMETIQAQGSANFSVPPGQINLTGRTQFKITLDTSCPWPSGNSGTNRWTLSSPHASQGVRPELTVTYQP